MYPESEPASVVTPASADLTDIKAPEDGDEVSHFVEVSREKPEAVKKRPFVGRGRGGATTDFQERIISALKLFPKLGGISKSEHIHLLEARGKRTRSSPE